MAATRINLKPKRTALVVLRGAPFALALMMFFGEGDRRVHAEGLTATDALFFTQETPGISDTAEQFDGFGEVLATGDFNNDGFDDLAIGIPSEDDQGAINVLYGAADGLFGDSDQQFWDIGGTQQLGHSMAVGDFNADGFDDLAAGFTYSGEEWITTYHGYPSGLNWQPTFSVRVLDFAPGYQWDTSILAAGELSGDQYDDIAVQFHAIGNPDGIMTLHGSDDGVTSDSTINTFLFGSPSPTLPTAIALGDFDANSRDDIVLGFANATVNAQAQAGEARLFFNGSAIGSETWHQDSAAIVGGSEAGDRFGYSLATGDMSGDGIDDLFVGVPFEDAAFTEMGAFQAILGDGSGLTATGNQLHNTNGFDEAFAHYSSSLAVGNFDDGDYAVEVAGGAPQGSATQFNSDAGTVSIRFSNATVNHWHQDVAGVPDAVEANDSFGDALAVGDFDGDGDDDLAIGAPGETIGPVGKFCGCHGSVTILNGNRRQPLESVKQIIGATGGTVGTGTTDAVEVTLTMPSGALASDTSITVHAYSTADVGPPPGGGNYLSRSYQFEPPGLVFATPAVLQINYSDLEVAAMDETMLGIWLFDSASGQWESATVIQRNLAFNYILVEIPHFSKVSLRDFSETDLDADGCTDAAEVATLPNSQTSGGLRNPANYWDYFNPTGDGINRVDDILAVVNAYFSDDSDGNPGLPPYAEGYDPDFDRTLVGPLDWHLGPPNGLQRVDDILNAVKQYFHDCP